MRSPSRIPPAFPVFLLLALLGPASPAPLVSAPPEAGALPPAPRPVAEEYRRGFEAIEEADIRSWVRFLSAPELRGRESGDIGYDVAARYSATVLERAGVRPMGDPGPDGRTFLQRFNLIQRERDHESSSLRLRLGEKRVELESGEEFRGSGDRWADLEWKEGAVCLRVPEKAKLDLPGLLEKGTLGGRVPVLFLENEKHALADLGLKSAPEVKVVVVSDHYFRRNGRRPSRKVPEYLEPERLPVHTPHGECVFVSREQGQRILELLGKKRGELPVDPGADAIAASGELRIELNLRNHRRVFPTSNVVGVIEGSDPILRDEYVAVGAHLDHVGQHDGKVFYGADDNASGSAAVLALGEAFNALEKRPRRSILLALWGAEEIGLLGSGYFVENSPVAIGQVITYLNLDMIGRDETRPGKDRPEDNRNSVNLVGSRRYAWDLHHLISVQNRMVGLDLEDDQEDVFFRSDQFHFDRKGVPVIFFFAGFHPDYHKPTDTPEKLNYPKITRIARLCYLIGHRVANRESRFTKDRQMSF